MCIYIEREVPCLVDFFSDTRDSGRSTSRVPTPESTSQNVPKKLIRNSSEVKPQS